jgi:hypothetical protein
MSLLKLNPVEPPWYGPVCPVVWEGWCREASPYPDQPLFLALCEYAGLILLSRFSGPPLSIGHPYRNSTALAKAAAVS